jgi:hypothetical protein
MIQSNIALSELGFEEHLCLEASLTTDLSILGQEISDLVTSVTDQIVLDGAGSAKKKPEKTAISWVDAEWSSLDDHLKQTYGLTGPRNAAPGFACQQNIREVMY